MKALPIEFKKYGNIYTQVRRNENAAIYALHDGENGRMLGYEVHKVSSHNGFELGGNFVEPAENLAGTEQFGTNAFYFGILSGTPEAAFERAEIKFTEFEKKALEKLETDAAI